MSGKFAAVRGTKLCEQQPTEATIIPWMQKSSENDADAPLPSLSIVPTHIVSHIVRAAWTCEVRQHTASHVVLSQVARPVKDFIVRQICCRFCSVVHMNMVERARVLSVMDIFIRPHTGTLTHLTPFPQNMILLLHTNKSVPRNSWMAAEIGTLIPVLASPFRMKIHYCVIVKFLVWVCWVLSVCVCVEKGDMPVCYRRHMRESDVAQTTRLAIFKCRIKDESFGCIISSTILSLGWETRSGLGISYIFFTLLRRCVGLCRLEIGRQRVGNRHK